jgi:serine protease Do
MRRLALSAVVVALLGLGAYGVFDRENSQAQGAQAQETQTQETQAQETQAQETQTTQGTGTTESTSVSVQPLDENAALLEDENNTINVIDTFGNSVVAINITVRGERVDPFADLQNQLPPGFELPPQFQQPQGQNGEPPLLQGAGSGFVIDEEGHIATNFHVVQEALKEGGLEPVAGAELTVVFPGNDAEMPVTVIGVNALYDLALLKLDNPADLPATVTPLTLADSDALRVGQKTIAIGNPFGLESTVTTGIVSATNRSAIPSIGGITVPMVQTDASINPGNSGGPLLNSKGEVIGINTAIIPSVGVTGERGSLGIGFAMPSNTLRDNLDALLEGGFVGDLLSRPRIGVSIAPVDTPELFNKPTEDFNLPTAGVVVTGVTAGGPGDKAGLLLPEPDANNKFSPDGVDIILEVDGTPVSDPAELQRLVLGKGDGDVVTLKVWNNGEERDVDVTLEVVAEQAQR